MESPLSGRDFSAELQFTASRSSGAGGQNVNKVNTKVELRFDISSSALLSDKEKSLIFVKLANRINSEGILILTSQVARSQFENREKVTEKFYKLIRQALTPRKRRIATSPTLGSLERKKKEKKLISDKKSKRKNPEIDE